MKTAKRTASALLSAALLLGNAMPAFADAEQAGTDENTSSAKEEVIYINLDAGGGTKDVYAVNIFGAGDITDYGYYSSVRMLNSNDEITQDGDRITFSTTRSKVYYQGTMEDAEVPWDISIRYFLDGTEYSAGEIAGRSGELEIRFQITKNEECAGSFYDDYALQATFTLDTERCSDISAPDATVANVGNDKQLTYTILPGEGIDTVITADVEDFEMVAAAINGIHLNLSVEVDDAELRDKVNDIIDATVELDDGARELYDGSTELLDGSGELVDGASSLHSGIAELDNGVATLQSGMVTVQDGLYSLTSQSSALISGSEELLGALTQIQSAVSAISVNTEEIAALATASGQISQAISALYDGAATLQANLGYAQYKALMEQNGLDIDTLKAGNTQAVSDLQGLIASLQSTLSQISGVPEMEEQAAQLRAQIVQLQQIITLLEGNNAAIGGTETYLNNISAQLPALTEGLQTLKTQYEKLDVAIGQLVTTLTGMLDELSTLADGIDQLVAGCSELCDGIWAYTDGVAQLAAGYSQVMDGVSSLAEGSRGAAVRLERAV